jgi:hypothetical protein
MKLAYVYSTYSILGAGCSWLMYTTAEMGRGVAGHVNYSRQGEGFSWLIYRTAEREMGVAVLCTIRYRVQQIGGRVYCSWLIYNSIGEGCSYTNPYTLQHTGAEM